MKCIGTYTYDGKTWRLYVDLESRRFFILLPSFKITKFLSKNNYLLPKKAVEIFERRWSDFQMGKIKFA